MSTDVIKKVLKRTVSLTSQWLNKKSSSSVLKENRTLSKKAFEDSNIFLQRSNSSTKTGQLKHSISLASIPTSRQKKEIAKPVKNALPYRSMILCHSDWTLELGDPNAKPFIFSPIDESNDTETWYTNSFIGKKHHNFIATDKYSNPVSISLMKEDDNCKAIIRTTNGNQHIIKSFDDIKLNHYEPKKMIKMLNPSLHLKQIREIKEKKHEEELSVYQSNEVNKKLKFGVLYCRKGQMNEDEMFSNTKMSKKFNEFLNFLGDRVELKGFNHYNGGLDTTNNSTGEHSVYTKWNGYEIMFHVSTLLPYKEGCEQQIERKRHIGNDIVVIVFQDGVDEDYDPSTLTTQFQHILAVVQREPVDKGIPRYRFQIAKKKQVPEFEPQIPFPSVFEGNEKFRNFFLSKLVNGEKAAMNAPEFKNKVNKTRAGLLNYYGSVY